MFSWFTWRNNQKYTLISFFYSPAVMLDEDNSSSNNMAKALDYLHMIDQWQWLLFTWCKTLLIPCKADFHWSCEAPDQFTRLYNMISCKKHLQLSQTILADRNMDVASTINDSLGTSLTFIIHCSMSLHLMDMPSGLVLMWNINCCLQHIKDLVGVWFFCKMYGM